MKRVFCFGEVLWDLLPTGEKPGGSPLNVAYHLRRLGAEPCMVSAVGNDPEGARLLDWLKKAGISTGGVTRHESLPTGKVAVQLDGAGEATFEISNPAAWDVITMDDCALHQAAGADAIVYGTLACRSKSNRAVLKSLLALSRPLKVLDVNLRPPADDLSLALELGRRSGVIKLNEAELFRLAELPDERDGESLHAAVSRVAEMTGCPTVCVTRGARGAVALRRGRWYSTGAPEVKTRDTVGAGDAFAAAFLLFLLEDDLEREFAHALADGCRVGAFVASRDGAQPAYEFEDIFPASAEPAAAG